MSKTKLTLILLSLIQATAFSQIMMETEIMTSGSGVYNLDKKDLGKLCPAQYRNNDLLLPDRKLDFMEGPNVNVQVDLIIENAPFDSEEYPNLAVSDYTSVVIAEVSFSAWGKPQGLGDVERVGEALGELITIGELTTIFDLPCGSTEDNRSSTSAESFDNWEIVVAGIKEDAIISHLKERQIDFRKQLSVPDINVKMPDSGFEFLFCNDGTVYPIIEDGTNLYPNPYKTTKCGDVSSDKIIWRLDVIGDTGGPDINTDPNDKECGCESRIDNLTLDSLQLFVSYPEEDGSYPEPLFTLNDTISTELARFYCEYNGDDWNNNTNWLTTEHYCDWYGIVCDDNQNVLEINLSSNNLTEGGPLPDIKTLRRVNFRNNDLDFFSLYVSPQLEYLDLSENDSLLVNLRFSCVGDSQLKKLYLSNCSGIYMGDYTYLPELTEISLANLDLNDEDLTELDWPNLNIIDLSHNPITRVPSDLYDVDTLRALIAENTQITSITDSIGVFTEMEVLSYYGDTMESISPAIGTLNKLVLLDLGTLNLESCFPQALQNLCDNLAYFGAEKLKTFPNTTNVFAVNYDKDDLCENGVFGGPPISSDFCELSYYCQSRDKSRDSDGDGFCNFEDCDDDDPFLFPLLPGTPCDDGNPITLYDVILSDGCTCMGVLCDDLDNDGYCAEDDCDDNDPNIPGRVGECCDDNNSLTYNDRILADGCACAGKPIDKLEVLTYRKSNFCEENFYVQIESFSIQVPDYESPISGGEVVAFCGLGVIRNPRIASGHPTNYGNYKISFPNGEEYSGYSESTSNSQVMELDVPPLTIPGVVSYSFVGSVEGVDVEIEGSVIYTSFSCGCDIDEDSDGVCADQDCDDNNPLRPGLPGMLVEEPADMNDPFKVLMEDGCSIDVIPLACEHVDRPIYVEVINLYTQSQVDDFIMTYSSCPSFYGDIYISDAFTNVPSINDLSGFAIFERIYGNVTIENTSSLTSTYGLHNLLYVGSLRIVDNNISQLDLSNLKVVGGDFEIKNNKLTELSNVDALHTIWGQLKIEDELLMSSISTFSNLDIIVGSLYIRNTSLENIDAFNTVDIVGEIIVIANNSNLSSCSILPVCLRLVKQYGTGTYAISNNKIDGSCYNAETAIQGCINTYSCITNRVLNYPIDNDQIVKAGQSIKASNYILNHSDIILQAGNDIQFLPDFSIILGSTLTAEIKNCEN